MSTRVINCRYSLETGNWIQDPAIYKNRTDGIWIDRRSIYGNPFRIGTLLTRQKAIDCYRVWLAEHPKLIAQMRRELTGKTLLCWCKPLACHGDVIVEVCET